jgi:hypothetical protein
MTRQTPPRDQLKEATVAALRRIAGPMLDLVFDAGITVHEFTRLIRERAVWAAEARVAKESGRSSKSKVAIITGLPRSEVARILGSTDTSAANHQGQHPGRKVLSAWYDSPGFLSPSGDPAVLPIFGKRRSFERLVAMNSSGIPVRAMLDQLVQVNAVELLSGQRVRARARVPVFTGLTSSAIAGIGERATDLLQTLKSNLSSAPKPLFEGTAWTGDIEVAAVPLVRKEIAEQGATFIESANSLLNRSRTKPRRASRLPKCRIGVTVYYFQDEAASGERLQPLAAVARRKNLHRRNLKIKVKKAPKLSE